MIIGLIREEKTPRDNRVVLTPEQCELIQSEFPEITIIVQPSEHRSYSDEEYLAKNIMLSEDLSNCDLLIGVKEVPIESLIPNKKYCFFSHTIKKQEYNRKLLQAILEKNIELIDYECLTNDIGIRIIAFGRWAGIVGAYNALWTYGKRTAAYNIKRAYECHDFSELKEQLKKISLEPVKIIVTGNGRVAKGALEIMEAANIEQISSEKFLKEDFNKPVFVQLDCDELFARKSDGGFEWKEFFTSPEKYNCDISAFLSKAEIFINAIYWDPKAPSFFSLEDMTTQSFRVNVIADITCDIAPESSIPSTIRSTTIEDPVFAFDPESISEKSAFNKSYIDVMAVDNLPNELARDASKSFGEMYISEILPEFQKPESELLNRATITRNGALNTPFLYLSDYVNGK